MDTVAGQIKIYFAKCLKILNQISSFASLFYYPKTFSILILNWVMKNYFFYGVELYFFNDNIQNLFYIGKSKLELES